MWHPGNEKRESDTIRWNSVTRWTSNETNRGEWIQILRHIGDRYDQGKQNEGGICQGVSEKTKIGAEV